MPWLDGLDRYGGGTRRVSVDADGPHVVIRVEATSGSREGEALLTPDQARAVAGVLEAQAGLAKPEIQL